MENETSKQQQESLPLNFAQSGLDSSPEEGAIVNREHETPESDVSQEKPAAIRPRPQLIKLEDDDDDDDEMPEVGRVSTPARAGVMEVPADSSGVHHTITRTVYRHVAHKAPAGFVANSPGIPRPQAPLGGGTQAQTASSGMEQTKRVVPIAPVSQMPKKQPEIAVAPAVASKLDLEKHSGPIEFGHYLAEARTRCRLTCREVEETTRIRADYIEALEREDLDHLPPPVYVLAYVRTLGNFYKLDPALVERMAEQIRSSLTRKVPDAFINRLDIDSDGGAENEQKLHHILLLGGGILLLVALLFGGGIYYLVQYIQNLGGQNEPGPASAETRSTQLEFDQAQMLELLEPITIEIDELVKPAGQ